MNYSSTELAKKGDLKVIKEYIEILEDVEIGVKGSYIIPLDEAIYSLEGIANYQHSDARFRNSKREVIVGSSLDIVEVDEQGEVWINIEQVGDRLDFISNALDLGVNEWITYIDVQVHNITSEQIDLRISYLVAESQESNIDFSWFQEGESYYAMGPAIIDDPYAAEALYNYSNQPAHIGYPAQPYPAWIHINDKLNRYYDILDYTSWNGQPGLYLTEKVWFTNINIRNYDHQYTDPSIALCPIGRMDYVYMAGSQWSTWWAIVGASCGCEDAPVDVFAASSCGNYCEIAASVGDELLNYERMNGYLAYAIEFIDAEFQEFQQSGIPNPGIANISYFGAVVFGPQLYTTAITHVRYHNCRFTMGTRNVGT
jgi:hypothetical protein